MIDRILFPYEMFDRNVLSLVMIGILASYLGVHVVVKRIVFVGVALAETSAMGIGFAFFAAAAGWVAGVGIDPHAWERVAPLCSSLLFTLAGVALFGVHHSGKRISQESIIGVGYTIAAGMAVLLIYKSVEGLDALRNLVAGDVLVVTDLQFRVLFWTFLGIMCLHLAFSKEFLFSSFDRDSARTLRVPARFFDLLLYLSVGVAVSVSLRSSSILLVVGFMILPPVTAMLLVRRFGQVQILSVSLSVVASVVGVAGALYVDREGGGLPVGPTVIGVLAILFLGSLAASWQRHARKAFLVIIVVLTVVSLVLSLFALRVLSGGSPIAEEPSMFSIYSESSRSTHEETIGSIEALFSSQDPRDRLEAVRRLATWNDPHATEYLVEALDDEDGRIRRETVLILGGSGSRRSADALARFLDQRDPDPGMEWDIAEALARLGSPLSIHALIHIVTRRDTPPFFRKKAHDRLRFLSGESFPMDDLQSWHDWWDEHRSSLRYDPETGRFTRE